ncbi:hypothetical protein C5E07_12645 [Pseudoclavibacter sp. RFBJ3]|uniref:AraC family transcriptional regulator n=1 Tax=unclassified Pseudoclavibacter TaxID=2615177 RepID=UPI000CE79AD9|nr:MULTISPECIES: helix-turn-helix domain-containing protein [unclassified Pseudoclavibacter]MBF4552278.1 helix-turn-helix domain-containing protein [Pseudoclavibacter sp. VKM Ac-2888]PPF74516.1 hypothetical protein C5B99_13930 [Pseudoclavibacter sp. Z016]PPF82547.1 hypothetical protein C5C12_11720 [Pseudoclavibacter sp. RFBJ5]PPF91441.1 hypothetical protein C5E07_12645 [Pseudoclavibacter sp. RFBJ3]PPF96365.1 hypothetical protein C5C19_15335 [Pseudoclavibacter sp. RFBH5]
MAAPPGAHRSSLILSSQRSVVDGVSASADVETGVGRFSSDDRNWHLSAAGVVFENGCVFRAEVRTGPVRIENESARQRIVLGLVRQGRLTIDPTGASHTITASGGFFLGPGAQSSMRFEEASAVILASVPAQVAADLGVRVSNHSGVLRSDTALARPVTSFLEVLARLDEDPTVLSSYFLQQLLHEQSGALLLSSEGFHADVQVGTQGLYPRALELMIVRRADPDVSPSTIARDLSVSLRQLQREFHTHGDAPASALRRARAELAHQLLNDERYAQVPVTQLAELSGFSSSQVMHRVLKRYQFNAVSASPQSA